MFEDSIEIQVVGMDEDEVVLNTRVGVQDFVLVEMSKDQRVRNELLATGWRPLALLQSGGLAFHKQCLRS